MKVMCSSLIGGRFGESLYEHIVFDGTFFNVGDVPFNVTMLGKIEEGVVGLKYKGERKMLKSFDLEDKNCRQGIIPKTLTWNGKTSPVVSLVFLNGPKAKHMEGENKNRLRTNVRCPLPIEYWKEIGIIERSGENIRGKKETLKREFSIDYDLGLSGARIILPEEQDSQNSISYLIAMAAGSSFEWILSRKSKYPNTYRIDALSDGSVKVTDPRKEARD